MDLTDSKASNSYWQYISSLTPAESEDSIKDLFRDNFDFISFYLDDIYFISANVIFLSWACGVSQKAIGKVFGISQCGASKQVKSARRKIRHSFLKPETNPVQVREDLECLLPQAYVETVVLYYYMHMYSVVAQVMGEVTEGAVRSRVNRSLGVLSSLMECKESEDYYRILCEAGVSRMSDYEFGVNAARRYHIYLLEITSTASYGDHQFRKRLKRKIIKGESDI
jgi:hypothetical protein